MGSGGSEQRDGCSRETQGENAPNPAGARLGSLAPVGLLVRRFVFPRGVHVARDPRSGCRQFVQRAVADPVPSRLAILVFHDFHAIAAQASEAESRTPHSIA